MGLDIEELILAVEDGFQIHIADEEAKAVSTAGDLYTLVVSKLKGKDSGRCLTSAAFYRTRRGIIDALSLERKDVRPSTPLNVILPEENRRETWRRIQDSMELQLPDLEHRWSTVATLLATGVALTVWPGLYARVGPGGLALLSFLGLVVGGFLVKFSPVWAVAFPNHDATVGDLARDVVAINHGLLVAEIGTWNKHEVWDILRRIIVTQTGGECDETPPEEGIVDDPGIG
ncbi:MAG: hypothetical protein ABI693_10780 [Bryobacteraceae bacterium]